MNPSLHQIRALLDSIQPDIHRAIADQLAGHPKAQAYDTDKTTGSHGSDPTATAATTPDRARHDLTTLEAATVRAYTALLCIAALSAHYEPENEPSRTDPPPQPRACKLHILATGQAHKVHRISDMAKHLDPPLPEPTPLCEACYDAIRYYGTRPTKANIIHKERTGRWDIKARRPGKAA